jgi:glutathione synthase/RimK-type ligase-like ATP-grasp enzyme
MKYYCLHEGFYHGVQLRLDQIKAACNKLNIEFVPLNSLTFDYSNLPQLSKNDLLYNATRGSETLETLLLNKNVTTYYINNPEFVVSNPDTTKYSILHDKGNLTGPKTIYNITADRFLLKKYIDYLEGFPIVIKATGSTLGIGTIKIETWQNLISTVDYLMTTGHKFIMRQFIKAKSGCRMIVLGNEVIAAADFAMNEGDFRNAAVLSETKYYTRDYPDSIKQIAIKATHLANTEFSGVDFLEDENGDYYLLEINFPTGFSSLIDLCGVDIPEKMVDFLMQKAKSK